MAVSPAMHAQCHACPLPCTTQCHACPHHACPLPCNPPPMHTFPLPCTPPAMHVPTTHVPRMPPPTMHTTIPPSRMPPPPAHTPVNRITDACENITFAGGKYSVNVPMIRINMCCGNSVTASKLGGFSERLHQADVTERQQRQGRHDTQTEVRPDPCLKNNKKHDTQTESQCPKRKFLFITGAFSF